jgi:hypothetical protein
MPDTQSARVGSYSALCCPNEDLPELSEQRFSGTKRNLIQGVQSMYFIRSTLTAVAILGIVTSGAALAQTTPRRDPGRLNVFHSTAPSSSTSSKSDDVSKWTTRQWNRAKVEWAVEKAKWVDCQKQSKDRTFVTDRKSWSFLASCMTS